MYCFECCVRPVQVILGSLYILRIKYMKVYNIPKVGVKIFSVGFNGIWENLRVIIIDLEAMHRPRND